jgi:hypothetical protein
MEQFNKALSFILGLVVVAVFIIVASGKFNFKGLSVPKASTAISGVPTPKPTSKPWFSFGKPAVTPTAKPTPKVVATQKITVNNTSTTQKLTVQDPNYHSYSGSSTPTSIPNTGIPVVLFPLFGTSLLTGVFMRKSGKK